MRRIPPRIPRLAGLAPIFNRRYDVEFRWLPFDAPNAAAGPSIFTAVRELGSEVDSGKGPTEVFVIDHADKPSEN